MIVDADEYLAHYGILRKSGRYPWGSGGNQSEVNRQFLGYYNDLRKQGLTDAQIAAGLSTADYPVNSSVIRAAKSIALAEQKQSNIRMAQRMHDKGMSNGAIGERMGLNESSVRSLLAPGAKDKADALESTANMLKQQIADKGLIDVGVGVNLGLGISEGKLRNAVAMLQEEGYKKHYVKVKQLGTGKETTLIVLSKPGMTYSEVMKQRDNIQQIGAHVSDDGRDFVTLREPTQVKLSRVGVRYAEDGGTTADGVIYVRPGAKDLSLGNSNYAQVRIAVNGTHYLKGMAVYKEDLPDGVDLLFNTNKSDTGNKLDSMKPQNLADKLNPFGAAIKPGGQRGALNIVNEEGDWDGWSRNLSSQFLSKQSPSLAKTQLNMTFEKSRKDLDEIKSLTNPTVKKKLLETYADGADSSSVLLKAAILPGTANHVILPVNGMKDTEIFAPNFKNGTRVALVRHPHGGTFEIPELTVNNRHPEASRIIGKQAKDAVGINSRVAERLSGADFDGDSVLVIPNDRGRVKSTPPLAGLKDFDPKAQYKIPDGSAIPRLKKENIQFEMGGISNLITDMTIKGAPTSDIVRAVRHSMVVIDAHKHGLDYKGSAQDNGIAQLKAKYQDGANKGATTIVSRSSSTSRPLARKLRSASEGGPIDKATGKLVYVETGETYQKNGQTVSSTTRSKRMLDTDDAHTLVSQGGGTRMERVYADHANRLKALANEARKETLGIVPIRMSPSSKKAYANEVSELDRKLTVALKNAPLERQAQVLANALVRAKEQANPGLDKDDKKKIRNQALAEARVRTGANKQRVDITQSEWNAIQAGAISPTKLSKILDNADIDVVRALATPRKNTVMTSAKQIRAKAMLASGATQAEIASALGVNLSTLKSFIAEGGGS